MTNEEKQALIEDCQRSISDLEEDIALCYAVGPEDYIIYLQSRLKRQQIALSALTVQPVKLPKGFSPGIGDLFDKAAPVMRRDSEGGKWLHKTIVAQILNDLGYEVQE